MDSFLDWLQNHTGRIAAILVAVTTIIVTFKKLKQWTSSFIEMPAAVKFNKEQVEGFNSKFQCITNKLDDLALLNKDTQERLWRTTIEDSDIPTYWLDPGGECILVNHAFVELFKVTEKDLQDGGWANYVEHQDDLEEIQRRWQQAQEHQQVWQSVYTHKNVPGKKIIASIRPFITDGVLTGWEGRMTRMEDLN